MFTKVLIANRGEIACRIIRTLRRMGIRSVAIYSEADAHARHVALADEDYLVGPAPAAQSYLAADRILQQAIECGAQAIHPGYGFLSENADFAEACERRGIRFIGPSAAQIRSFGLKHEAREIAAKSGVPMLPGSGLVATAEEALVAAERIGFPVMLKSTAGGGGIGLQLCQEPADFLEKFATVQHLGESNFKEAGVFVEKFVTNARHIEVQIFGDGHGGVMALGERDCSTQRRNQKVIEETPAPGLDAATRERLCAAAVSLGEAVNYQSAGTVEFIFDDATGEFYFLEVNTRLQVEHGVTEEVTGIDLVEWMIQQAAGELPPLSELHREPAGHSLQLRIYAEDPAKNFQPASGLLTEVAFPENVRIDTWIETGTEVSPYYDPLVAKIIVKTPDRGTSIDAALSALTQSRIHGIETNQAYLAAILRDPEFVSGKITTRFLNSFAYEPATVDVLEPGTQTSVQDFPGRLGYWSVGVPPSGPMDSASFRLANRVLANPESAAGLEITMAGPTLRFNRAAMVCLGGPPINADLDGDPVPLWTPIPISAGQTLRIGNVTGPGARAYLAFAGGLDVPEFLGSRATFALGGFGGHGGRTLRAGDVLRLPPNPAPSGLAPLPESERPIYTTDWTLGVIYGPHGAPDFFTDDDIAMIFGTSWKVHYNSNRTGVRLVGPKPNWARQDGGEAGLHPSNIHDNAYAIGAVDFTGDMPILLGPDGPSLGGFVCPAVVISDELWKLGQLKAGDTVRFNPVADHEPAAGMANSTLSLNLPSPVLDQLPASGDHPAVVYRAAGDANLLVEYGPLVLDLDLRLRVHALMQWLQAKNFPGTIDLTPGIRSLQIHFDPKKLPRPRLLDALHEAEHELPAASQMEVPSRVVHLPLSWDDDATRLAIQKYMQSVRADAPWCPSNLEFIRRINGLDNLDAVRRVVFDASYFVLGLGDVYLGAPVATPLDPRHRLVTTKYNPARTWTPQNAVGIGGAYLCIYGMEGPGGYQFVGRTLQVWNSFRTTPNFPPGTPWLLRFFDQIRFYPVTAAELARNRADFLDGRFLVTTEDTVFKLADYHQFLRQIAPEAATFKARQQQAFDEERERWAQANINVVETTEEPDQPPAEAELPDGGWFLDAQVAGSVWKILVRPGASVEAGESIAIIESMKMEIHATATRAGLVHSLLMEEGRPVAAGQHLAILQPKP